MTSEIAVKMTGIVKKFPGVIANDHVNLEIMAGEVHALLGENGAGKSTLSNILTGLYRQDAGTVELSGKKVEFNSPRDALNAGIGMVHQHFRLVSTFTVAENVVLGESDSSLFMDQKAVAGRVQELSDRYGLAVDPSARIWQLSVGEQQRVEILKVLYRGARILILDEPTAVLTPIETTELFKTLRVMVSEGRVVIFISHKLDEVMAVSDRVTVLRGGRTVGTVNTRETSTTDLASLMVGRSVEFNRVVRQVPAAREKIVLDVRDLCAHDDRGRVALESVSLSVSPGEIVGIAGVAGNGQRELAEVISGMRPITSGSITVDGESVQSGRARSAIAKGIAHVPEDRLHTGLASNHSVEDNFALKNYRSMSRFRILQRQKIRDQSTHLIERYDIKTPGSETPVRLLSGGNVQKVLLAREFSASPKVLIAASPTRGLDVGAIETVRERLVQAADSGVGVLLISEDLDEILSLADRILVMYEGRIVAEVEAAQADRARIGLTMGGITT